MIRFTGVGRMIQRKKQTRQKEGRLHAMCANQEVQEAVGVSA